MAASVCEVAGAPLAGCGASQSTFVHAARADAELKGNSGADEQRENKCRWVLSLCDLNTGHFINDPLYHKPCDEE